MPSPSLNPNTIWSAVLMKDGTRQEVEMPGVMSTTNYMEIKNSIWNMFPVVEWSYKYTASFLESGDLYIGRGIRFSFNDPDRQTLVDFEFCIYSINNLPGSSPSYLGELFQITCVPQWVFKQVAKSKAYKDSGSNIVDLLFKEELGEYLKPGVVISSFDSKRTRYRTFQTPYDFLKNRVIPYIRGKDNTSVFAYTTLQNTYEVIDVAEMKIQPSFVLIDKNSPNISAFLDQIRDLEKGKSFLFPHSHTLSLGNSEGGGLWPLLNPKLITLSTTQAGQVKDANTEPTIPNLTPNFDKKFVIASPNKSPDSGKVYIDDSLRTQEDILSHRLNKYSKDLMDSQKFISPCYFNPYIRVGRLITLYTTVANSSRLSLYSQQYIVTGVTHRFDERLSFTIVEYTTTSFTSNNSILSVSDTLLNFRD